MTMLRRSVSIRRLLATIALPLLALAAGAAMAQVAGKVVLAVGDVAAVRGAERIRLASGAEIRVGDAVVTGAQSHAQLRFSDAALVALKPDSEFRIETYDFTGEVTGNERAVFRLVRGGFRTVTGSIGQINKDRYQEQVGTATEVIDAQTLLTQIRTENYQAIFDYQVALIRVKRARGEL